MPALSLGNFVWFVQGTRVWLPDRTQVWIPGHVVSVLSEGINGGVKVTVQPDTGEGESKAVVCALGDLPPLRNPDLLLGANDLTTLSYLHEPAGVLCNRA